MNIAFDAKRAYLNSSGLGNYSRTLIKSINEYAPNNSYTLLTTRQSEEEFQKWVSTKKNIKVLEPTSFIDKKIRARWRSFGITEVLNQQNIDLYHGLSNELPFNIKKFKGKKVVTVHDLIFLRYPKLYPLIDSKIYNKKFRHACDVADVIIATSEETKRDIEHFYFIPEERIKVVYQSCSDYYYQSYSKEEVKAIKTKHELPKEYLLYVGTIEERKNLLTIIKALTLVKDIPLVIVGKRLKYYHTIMEYIKENKLSNRVIFLKDVQNQELPTIYNLAKIFILPSVSEGFGIPIIEALISKTAVITTKGGCFPEAGGPNSIYIDPMNENEMVEKINFLLLSDNERKAIENKGYEFAQKFHPEKITKQLLEIYTDI